MSDETTIDQNTEIKAEIAATHPILFFDGVCGLCNRFVDLVLASDKQGKLRLTPLQGETAQKLLEEADRKDMESFVLWVDGDTHRRSSAALKVFGYLGGFWSLMSIFWIVPRPIRDWVYNIVAANRYNVFGKSDTCRLPTPEERARFLD